MLRAIRDFFTPEPEEPKEITLKSLLGGHFSKFKDVYGIDLGGILIHENDAVYSVGPSQENPNSATVSLRCRTTICGSYPREYRLDELCLDYPEFEKQVMEYFSIEHPNLKREYS